MSCVFVRNFWYPVSKTIRMSLLWGAWLTCRWFSRTSVYTSMSWLLTMTKGLPPEESETPTDSPGNRFSHQGFRIYQNVPPALDRTTQVRHYKEQREDGYYRVYRWLRWLVLHLDHDDGFLCKDLSQPEVYNNKRILNKWDLNPVSNCIVMQMAVVLTVKIETWYTNWRNNNSTQTFDAWMSGLMTRTEVWKLRRRRRVRVDWP